MVFHSTQRARKLIGFRLTEIGAMTRPPTLMLVLVLLAVAAYAACSDGATEPPAPDPPRATTLAVTPANVQLVALGATEQLTAEVRDQNGQAMAGAAVSWASSAAAVATVSSSGLVTAAGNGTATITATAGGASGTATVIVDQTANPDRAALVALYEATDGPNWVDNSGWLTDAPLGEWHGVGTDGAGRVVSLDLSGRWDNEAQEVIGHGLSGAIPAGLGALTKLRTLDLSRNELTGPIPAELGSLANLEELDLISNSLISSIPVELGNLSNLAWLDLAYNNLSGPIPSELGNLSNLATLLLGNNSLSGPIPAELGNLTNLHNLHLHRNDLTGPIPQSFLRLDRLLTFYVGGNEACVPGSSAFVAWLRGMESRDDDSANVLCNAADVAALKQLYQTAGGTDWTESRGWPGEGAVEEWHGVTADSLGRVTALDLSRNGLAGRLTGQLGVLARMTTLRIGNNALSGRLPSTLSRLSLVELHYTDTELCEPSDASFQTWLAGIRSHEGTGEECPPLTDREILEIFYDATGGPRWANNDHWLTDAPLVDWHGVWVHAEDGISLSLWNNNLTGLIPPELGNLVDLRELQLGGNKLTGPIPPELGKLASLTSLSLWSNSLSDEIPSELGDLANLEGLYLNQNDLAGAIPSALGRITNLKHLYLNENSFTGQIPPDLGLPTIEYLFLDNNDLAGPVPPAVGRMSNLKRLGLTNNVRMEGPLPHDLTALSQLEAILAGGTRLCAPSDPNFQAWLAGVHSRRITPCNSAAAIAAYLTQAVQSREHPVPLVAGEKALLRVFPTARAATRQGIPAVRAHFYLNGRETHVEDIRGNATPIPTVVDESSLANSANAEIPADVIQPGLEMVIEVDPNGTLDPALGVANRIPATGRLPVEVRALPLFDLTLIPFIWTQTQDSSIVNLINEMAADPENHEMLGAMRRLLPVGDLEVTAHEPVLTASNSAFAILAETEAIRVMEGGPGHYMGISEPVTGASGVAKVGGRSSFSIPFDEFIGHELGHNMSLHHAPCGVAGEPSFPYLDGSIGSWGYDFRDGGSLVSPDTPDVMSYCGARWVSDYSFTNALRYRLFDENPPAAAAGTAARSLLLWGGVSADSVPYLEPVFVVEAPAALPDSAGEYQISGRTETGAQLFALRFAMPETADGDGSTSFAFVLPVRTGWAGSLARITLTGPGGSFTLDGDSDIPMAILRNAQTGQIRGILRDPQPEAQAAADGVGQGAGTGLEMLFSRGIPGVEAWRR